MVTTRRIRSDALERVAAQTAPQLAPLPQEEEEDEPLPSPLFNSVLRCKGSKNDNEVPVMTPPPKSIYNDRFWSQATSSGNFSQSPAPPTPTPMGESGAFQFLDQAKGRLGRCINHPRSHCQRHGQGLKDVTWGLQTPEPWM